MKLNKVVISAGALLLLSVGGLTASADVKTDIHETAIEVISGKHGNGEERVRSLEAHGIEYQAVQDEVNRILLGELQIVPTTVSEAPVAPVQETAPVVETPAPVQETAPVVEQAPVQSAGGIDLNQTSGSVDINALANYMATNGSSAGYSASEWAYIFQHESNGSLTATNASSGAYGVFQLLGHGEYAGMTLGEQIAMASKLPAGSWVVYP
ncbi:MAG: hypothetical protein ACRCX2_38850 [Paraclostridium sp.]